LGSFEIVNDSNSEDIDVPEREFFGGLSQTGVAVLSPNHTPVSGSMTGGSMSSSHLVQDTEDYHLLMSCLEAAKTPYQKQELRLLISEQVTAKFLAQNRTAAMTQNETT